MNRTSANPKFPRKIGYINKIFFGIRLYLSSKPVWRKLLYGIAEN